METKRFKAPVIQADGVIAPQFLTPIVLDDSPADAPCLYAYKAPKEGTSLAYAPLYVKSSMNPHYGHKGVWLYICNHNLLKQALQMLGTTQEGINTALNKRLNELLDLCAQNRVYGGHGPASFARACNRWPEYEAVAAKLKTANEQRKEAEALAYKERMLEAEKSAKQALEALLTRIATPDTPTTKPYTLDEVKQVARHYGLWESQPIRTRGAWKVVDSLTEESTTFRGTKKQLATAKRSTAIPKLVVLYKHLKKLAQQEVNQKAPTP